MKKILLTFLTLIISFSFLSNVNAERGDLRYNITNIYTSGNNLIIEGWAFIHQTNNYITIYKRCETANCGNYTNHVDYNETIETISENGGQNVSIRAVNRQNEENKIYANVIMYEDYNDAFRAIRYTSSENLTEKTEVTNNDDKGTKSIIKNYNFYHEMYDQTDGDDKYEECYNNNKNCTQGAHYYYEDMFFKATIDLSKLKGQSFSLEIAATNLDYQKDPMFKYDYTPYEKMYVTSTAISASDKSNISVENISYRVQMIAESAKLLETDNPTNDKFNGDIRYFTKNTTYNIVAYGGGIYQPSNWDDLSTYGHANSNKRTGMILYGNNRDKKSEMFVGTYAPGIYILYASGSPAQNACSNYNENAFCKIDDKIITNSTKYNETEKIWKGINWDYVVAAYDSWVKPTGETLIITPPPEITPNKCSVSKPAPKTLSCNNSSELESPCSKVDLSGITVENLKQKVTVTSVLTPTKIYNGGAFKLNFLYYNEITWDGSANAKEQIKERFKDDFNLSFKDNNVKLKLGNKVIATLNDDDFIKGCKQIESSNKITNICMITLKNYTLEAYTGTTTRDDNSTINTNNKYYIPINTKGTYTIEGTLTGLSVIDPKKVKQDTKEEKGVTSWIGTDDDWKMDLTGCSLEVYDLIGMPTPGTSGPGGFEFNFIYRPIDISNPFPNRNAGSNWNECFKDNKCMNDLANTYGNGIKYSIVIGYNEVQEIRSYNKNYNYNSWVGIDEETNSSSFVTDNFDIKNR